MSKTMVATTATEIKKELKSTFPGVKFSVRSSSYNTGSSISIEWSNLPTVAAVEAITNKYSHVNRCEVTHEILSGGNTYISTYVDYTPEFIGQVEALMSDESKEIKGSYFYTTNFNKVVDQMWKEQSNDVITESTITTIEAVEVAIVTPVIENPIQTAINETPDQTKEELTNNVIASINQIQGVYTKETNMFNQHELYIDGVHVGYVREEREKFFIIPHFRFSANIGKGFTVNINELYEVVNQYRDKNIMMYKRSNPKLSIDEQLKLVIQFTPKVLESQAV